MPNRYQLAFLASFTTGFATLLFLSRIARRKISDWLGYDLSELILIGLPGREEYRRKMASSEPMPTDQLLELLKTNVYAQAAAAVVALLGAVLVYNNFVASTSSKKKPVLSPEQWQEFPLQQKIIISPNTAIYRFALPKPDDVLGLPIGQHISVSAEIGGKDITRSYTPTSSDDDLGHFDLLIKSYEKGNISRYVSLLKIGDKVRIKGPKGQFQYTPTLSRALGMIAGGTGITPMLQIIRAALKNPADKTKLSLIYANVNFEDILLKKELDELADKFSDRFQIYYVLNNPPEGWTGGVGFVSKEQIEKYMPPTSEDIKILMCGPPPMMNAMKKHLDELKYPAPRTVSKLVDQVFLF